MFEGTARWFKILYFITAMFPSYTLFLVQIDKICSLWVTLLLIPFLATYFLKMMLKKRIKNREGVGVNDYIVKVVVNKNGDITAFLLGVIIPTVISFSDNQMIRFSCFIALQIILYILMTKSSSIFPNVSLLIIGINIFELEDGKFILSYRRVISSNQEEKINIRRLGDSKNCTTYVGEV